MALTAGALSQVSVSSTTANLSSAVATMGTAPYTYQWYRSTVTGFSPGAPTLISGATSLTLADTGLTPNTPYFYVVKVTDSASPAATANATQLAVTTSAATQQQNVLSQAPVAGMIDQRFDYDTLPVQIDSTQSGTIYAGMPVKIVANTAGGIPRVISCSGITDNVFGFINFDIKTVGYTAGSRAEVSGSGNVIWLYSLAAITQGAQVCLAVSGNTCVQATGATATVVGFALDGAAAAGALIRVKLTCPTFATA